MLEQIKALREETGAGVVDVKKAIDEAGGDIDSARELLKKRGQAKAGKKADRNANEGVVGSYVHSNGKMGAMVKLQCETDFVARNEEFVSLARDIAMHIVASSPEVISPDEVSAQSVAKEREIWEEQIKSEGKPEEIIAKIMEGKEKKFREEYALMTQSFVKNPEQTIADVIVDASAKMGEKIVVTQFARISL